MSRAIANMQVRERMKKAGCIVVIPTYNNARTIVDVISDVKCYADDVLIVNDGSTDSTESLLMSVDGVSVIGYKENKGKGFAIRMGLNEAYQKGFTYAITLDSDGQHFAKDLTVFLDAIEKNPGSLLIGARNLQADNMPSKNTFANKFSNFWYQVETGKKLSDTQSGFRLYPLKPLQSLHFFTNRYEFEVEVIVKATWKGVRVANVPIEVYYQPVGERISHFRPGKDFFRISLLNTYLVILALLWYYPVKFLKSLTWSNLREAIRDHITHSDDSNKTLAMSIGLGVFCGIFPVWGYQMILAGVLAHFFKLNKVLAVLSSNISIPPMVPFILYGSFMTGALVLNRSVNFTFNDVSWEYIRSGLFQYLIGSTLLALAGGLIIGFGSLGVLTLSKRKK